MTRLIIKEVLSTQAADPRFSATTTLTGKVSLQSHELLVFHRRGQMLLRVDQMALVIVAERDLGPFDRTAECPLWRFVVLVRWHARVDARIHTFIEREIH